MAKEKPKEPMKGPLREPSPEQRKGGRFVDGVEAPADESGRQGVARRDAKPGKE